MSQERGTLTTSPAPIETGSGNVGAALRDLRHRFGGPLAVPGDDGYDAARLGWNRDVDSRPAIIATATSTRDVQVAVAAAHDHGLPLAVQSTGHGSIVATDGALLLKTSLLDAVEIDPARRRARVGPGAVWQQVNDAATPHGLASLAGRCATVGVVGYTLGGGTGWLSRRFGYAADSVTSASVVLADGRMVTASADEHPDLFWALRGGGGNFGIVTSLEFRLFPALEVFAGMSFYAADRAAATFAAYRDWAPSEPDESNSAVLLMRLPPAPVIPEDLRGRRVLAIRAFHLGSEDEGRRTLAPVLEAAGPPLVDRFAMRPFGEASTATNGPDAPPMAARQHVDLFRGLPGPAGDEVVDAMVEAGADDSPLAFVELRHWAGAMASPGPDAGPAGARDISLSVMAVGPYLTPDRTSVDVAMDRLAARLAPHASGTSFLNLENDPTRTRHAFTAENWTRLRQVKRAWDPHNVFHLNHNIPPAAPVHHNHEGTDPR